MVLEYRKALPSDFKQMVALQNDNLFIALSPKERESGFLLSPFTEAYFKTMDQEIGVVVCADGSTLCGYLCASTLWFNTTLPIPAKMVQCCEHLFYKGKPLSSYKLCVTSPLCIAKTYRKQAIFAGLCQKLAEYIPISYELALTFIATSNHRSLYLCKKIGFEIIDRFSVNEYSFWLLVRPVRL